MSISLLEKIISIKQSNSISTSENNKEILSSQSITLIKVSSDEIISSLSKYLLINIFNQNSNKPKSQLKEEASLPENIGLSVNTMIIKEKLHLIYDFNYLLSKKFRFLKTFPIEKSEKFIFLININDNRGISNIESIVNDIKALKPKEKYSFHAFLITDADNFLLKLIKDNQIDLIKNGNLKNTFQTWSEVEYSDSLYEDLDDEDYEKDDNNEKEKVNLVELINMIVDY